MNKYSLGFSPCPNDCFIFDAMIHGKIDTEGLEFDVQLLDVEALNKKAFNAEIDITKLSFHAFAYLVSEYTLLNSGSALGDNCGPLLISKNTFLSTQISNLKIAIPGKYTTANFLLSLAYPEMKNKIEYVFSDIEEAILRGEVDAGLIIHENRFTYEQKGLKKIIDLGEYWQKISKSAIPLGGIAVKRSLPWEAKKKIDSVLKKSVEYAFENPKSPLGFIKSHAQSMSEEVMYKHIHLYVNKYSIDLGKEGRNAIELLFRKAVESKIISEFQQSMFLN